MFSSIALNMMNKIWVCSLNVTCKVTFPECSDSLKSCLLQYSYCQEGNNTMVSKGLCHGKLGISGEEVAPAYNEAEAPSNSFWTTRSLSS